MILQKNTEQHRWNFSRFGGVTQVILKTADDLTHLHELDQKLWTVLSMPTQGIFFDPRTIALLDSDGDGFRLKFLQPSIGSVRSFQIFLY